MYDQFDVAIALEVMDAPPSTARNMLFFKQLYLASSSP